MSIVARFKYQVAVYAGTIGIVLIILGIVSIGVAGQTYLNPPVERIPPEEIEVQNFEVTVDHSAIVRNGSQLYDEGTTLRNHPLYYRDTMPVFTLTTRANVPDGKSVNISYQLMIRHSAEFNGEQFWQNETVLDMKEQQVKDGEFVSNFSTRISELETLMSENQQVIRSPASVSTQLGFVLTYESPAQGGGTYKGELSSFAQPFETTSQSYWFPWELSAGETKRQTTQPQTRKLSPNMQRIGLFIIIGLILGSAGVGVIWWGTQKIDIEELSVNITREKYDAWMSEGEFLTDSENQYVYINSLQDLVDIAIDSNKRVVYDSEFEAYSVVDESVIYYYAAKPQIIKNFLTVQSDA